MVVGERERGIDLVGPRPNLHRDVELVEPYEAVRTAADPHQTLLEFLHTSYQAAAERGQCDRAALEADPRRWDEKQ